LKSDVATADQKRKGMAKMVQTGGKKLQISKLQQILNSGIIFTKKLVKYSSNEE
jgi:hypothetical protein